MKVIKIVLLSSFLAGCAGSALQVSKMSESEMNDLIVNKDTDYLCEKYMDIKMAGIKRPESNIWATLNRKMIPLIEYQLHERSLPKDFCLDNDRLAAYKDHLRNKALKSSQPVYVPPAHNSASPVHCYSNKIGNQIYTNCY